jgi:hypothetical protein
MCPDVPEPAETSRALPNMQNEPTPDAGAERSAAPDRSAPHRPRPLSLRQHAAARALAAGYGSVAIAHHLGINHHTIGRWKRQPQFMAEVHRLREAMTAALIAPHARPPRPAPPPATSPPPAPRRLSPADADRQTEAMIDRLLARHTMLQGR